MAQFDTPIALIIYRRPDTTRRVFETVKRVQPSRLFIVADGPSDKVDRERCEATRSIVEKIDWKCDVYRNYADTNMGCRKRVSSGLDWVFENTDRAIILEDDCLPSESFFSFCASLLGRFEDDDRIMHINGNTFGADFSGLSPYSYGFCNYAQVWGWATWKRAWDHYDAEMENWPEFENAGFLSSLDGSTRALDVRREKWGRTYQKKIDTWDYQWHFAVASQAGLSIAPRKNMVSNIGFDAMATHTTNAESAKAEIKPHEIERELVHPSFVVADKRINKVYRENMLAPSLQTRIQNKLKRMKKRVWPL